MLPQANRLPTPEIRVLLGKGKRIQIPSLQLVYTKNNVTTSRFAFIVSTKIDKRATARNRIRRLLRESVRLLLPNLPSGFDVVLIVKNKNVGEDIIEVKPMVEELFKKMS